MFIVYFWRIQSFWMASHSVFAVIKMNFHVNGGTARFVIQFSQIQYYIDGLMQERHNSIANAMELRLSCINPMICSTAVEGSHKLCHSNLNFCERLGGSVSKVVGSLCARSMGFSHCVRGTSSNPLITQSDISMTWVVSCCQCTHFCMPTKKIIKIHICSILSIYCGKI